MKSHDRLLLFFHSGNVRRVLVKAMTMQRGADAQEKFKRVTKVVAIISIESVRATVDCKLGAEPDIKAVAMG